MSTNEIIILNAMFFCCYFPIVFPNQHRRHGHYLAARALKYNENHKALHRLELHPHLECDDFKNQQLFTHYQLEESVDVVWCHRLVSLIANKLQSLFPYVMYK